MLGYPFLRVGFPAKLEATMLRWISVLCACVVLQGLGSAQMPTEASEKPAAMDVIVLKNGSRLEGRILSEDEELVQILIGPGQKLGVRKKRISSYERRSDEAETEKREGEEAAFPLRPRSDWFRIRNAEGQIVGTLHLVANAEDTKVFRLEEQWTFREGRKNTLVSRIERVNREGKPVSLYFREAVIDTKFNKILSERLFQGKISTDSMVVFERTMKGKKERLLGFEKGNLFPLYVRESLRQGMAKNARSYHASVYDVMSDLFELRTYELEQDDPVPASYFPKLMVRKGSGLRIQSTSRGRTVREWVAPGGRVLLMEINGLDLVAEPIEAKEGLSIQKADHLDRKQLSPAQQSLGGFEVWLPRATWSYVRAPQGSRVLKALASIPDVEARAVLLDGFRDEIDTPEAAARILLQRWNLDHAWFEESESRGIQIHGRRWIRVLGKGRVRGDSGRKVPMAGILYLTRADQGWLLLSLAGPRKSMDRLEGEALEWVRNVRTEDDILGRR